MYIIKSSFFLPTFKSVKIISPMVGSSSRHAVLFSAEKALAIALLLAEGFKSMVYCICYMYNVYSDKEYIYVLKLNEMMYIHICSNILFLFQSVVPT